MHCEAHELALPKLPKGKEWCPLFTTDDTMSTCSINENMVLIQGRTVAIYISKTNPAMNTKKHSKKKKVS